MRATFIRLIALLALIAVVPNPSSVLSSAWAEDNASKTADSKSSDSKATDSKSTDTAKNIVAVFNLKGELLETPQDETFSLGDKKTTALKDLLERFKKARDDKNVKAVAITLDEASMGWAQIEELRQAIADLRSAGKDVYAHADDIHLGGYLLFCGATQLNVAPTGDVWLTGLHGETPYLRGLLTKIGVTPDFLTCGAYKSAAELFMREGPSPQAEEMTNWLLDSLYDTSVKLIAKGRGVETDKVKKWIDDGPYTARRCAKPGSSIPRSRSKNFRPASNSASMAK